MYILEGNNQSLLKSDEFSLLLFTSLRLIHSKIFWLFGVNKHLNTKGQKYTYDQAVCTRVW